MHDKNKKVIYDLRYVMRQTAPCTLRKYMRQFIKAYSILTSYLTPLYTIEWNIPIEYSIKKAQVAPFSSSKILQLVAAGLAQQTAGAGTMEG
jgi:hypothetical protein